MEGRKLIMIDYKDLGLAFKQSINKDQFRESCFKLIAAELFKS